MGLSAVPTSWEPMAAVPEIDRKVINLLNRSLRPVFYPKITSVFVTALGRVTWSGVRLRLGIYIYLNTKIVPRLIIYSIYLHRSSIELLDLRGAKWLWSGFGC